MKSPELAELCQALLEILRAAVAANQDQEQEQAPITPGGAAGTAKSMTPSTREGQMRPEKSNVLDSWEAPTRAEAVKSAAVRAPQVQSTPLKSTEVHEPGAGGTP